jgi:hypothetical protein
LHGGVLRENAETKRIHDLQTCHLLIKDFAGKRFVPAVYAGGLVIKERDAPLCRGSIAILLI